MQYLPHQQRVVDEKAELDLKREKLREFIDSSPIYIGLDDEDQADLIVQSEIMEEYSKILGLRIWKFN